MQNLSNGYTLDIKFNLAPTCFAWACTKELTWYWLICKNKKFSSSQLIELYIALMSRIREFDFNLGGDTEAVFGVLDHGVVYGFLEKKEI